MAYPYSNGRSARPRPGFDPEQNGFGGGYRRPGSGPGSVYSGNSSRGTTQFRGMRGAIDNIQNITGMSMVGDLTNAANAVSQGIFGPGGSAEQAVQQSIYRTVDSGFGPTSGGLQNAQMNIQRQGQDAINRFISEKTLEARALRGQELSDVFTGEASIEQLRLAQETQRQNQQIIDMQAQQQECGIGDRLGAGIAGAGQGMIGGGMSGLVTAGNPLHMGVSAGIGFLGGILGGC